MERTEWKLEPTWLSDPAWEEVAAAADRLSRVEVQAALAKLREWFPPSWSENCPIEHGVAGKQFTYVGRLSLLELGHAAVVADADESFTARLRDSKEYLGADAELRAMLLLKLSGAELERAPQGIGPRLSEFIAKWRSGSQAVVEVKAIRTSDEVEVAERLTAEVIFALMANASELPGFTGRVEWNEDVLFGSPPDIASVKKDAEESMAAAKALALSLPEFSVGLGAMGTLRLKSSSTATRLDFSCEAYAPTAAGIFYRIRRRCNGAVRQLATHPTLPGILILDIDADGLARNGLPQLARWATNKPQLGAVFVVAREYSVRRSHGHVCLLPGPRFDELTEALTPFERCDAGHLHFQPVCALECPCPTHFAFR